MKNLITFISIALSVSSCAVGVRYSSPKDGEPYAIISGNNSYIYTFKEDGCTDSYSYIKGDIKIHPNTPAFINYQEKIGSNHACFMWFSFIPEAGATYKIQTSLKRSEKEKSSILIPIFSGATCFAQVKRIDPDGSSTFVKLNDFKPTNYQARCKHSP